MKISENVELNRPNLLVSKRTQDIRLVVCGCQQNLWSFLSNLMYFFIYLGRKIDKKTQ